MLSFCERPRHLYTRRMSEITGTQSAKSGAGLVGSQSATTRCNGLMLPHLLGFDVTTCCNLIVLMHSP